MFKKQNKYFKFRNKEETNNRKNNLKIETSIFKIKKEKKQML